MFNQHARPNQTGDVEGAHGHLKRRLRNHLFLQGSPDFLDESAYVAFLAAVCTAANGLRSAKVEAECAAWRKLPAQRYSASEGRAVRGSSFSTVRVRRGAYSVPARLIGFTVPAHVGEREVFPGLQFLDAAPSLSTLSHGASRSFSVVPSGALQPGSLGRPFRTD